MKKSYVLGFIFSTDLKSVALLRKDRPEWQAGKLNGIGGKLEKEEDIFEGMVRECYEETGVNIPEEEWNYFAVFDGDKHQVHCFKTTYHDITQLICPESEVIEYLLLDKIHEENLMDNVKYLIPMALSSSKFAFIKE